MIRASIPIETVPVAITIPSTAGVLETLLDAALDTVQSGLSARKKIACTFQDVKADGSSRGVFNWGRTASSQPGRVAADTQVSIDASRLDRVYVVASAPITGVVVLVHLGS